MMALQGARIMFEKLTESLNQNRLEDLISDVPELAALKGVKQPEDVHSKDAWGHTQDVLAHLEDRRPVALWAAALHDIGKPATSIPGGNDKGLWFPKHAELGAKMADEVLHRLGAPTDLIHKVVGIVERHILAYEEVWSDKAVRRCVREVGDLAAFYAVVEADIRGCRLEHQAKRLPVLKAFRVRVETVPEAAGPKPAKITARGLLEKRLAWAKAAPAEPVWPGGPSRQEYVDGFVRKTGSFVREVTDMASLRTFFDRVGELLPIQHALIPKGCVDEACTYYSAALPEGYNAIAAATASDGLNTDQLEMVRVRPAPHGLEFQLDLPGQPTTTVKFIADDEGLRTWYPGEFLPPNPTTLTVKYTR